MPARQVYRCPWGPFRGTSTERSRAAGRIVLIVDEVVVGGKFSLQPALRFFKQCVKKGSQRFRVLCARSSRETWWAPTLTGGDARRASRAVSAGRPVGLRGAGDSVCQRPHHREKTGSRQLPAVKRGRVWLVPRLVTAWESQMRLARAFCERPPGRERKAA